MTNLTDILSSSGDGGNIFDLWNSTEAADDFGPLPRGTYVARIERGERQYGRTKGTEGYQLQFVVVEGKHTGRKLWHDLWFTPAAMAMSKRDLVKLGITTPAQLDKPFPPGVVCQLQVTLRKDDDGTERNSVRSFVVLRIESPVADPFAPDDNSADDTSPEVPF